MNKNHQQTDIMHQGSNFAENIFIILANLLLLVDILKKIQTKKIEKDIQRSKDITAAWLQGGKTIGEITKSKTKKK